MKRKHDSIVVNDEEKEEGIIVVAKKRKLVKVDIPCDVWSLIWSYNICIVKFITNVKEILSPFVCVDKNMLITVNKYIVENCSDMIYKLYDDFTLKRFVDIMTLHLNSYDHKGITDASISVLTNLTDLSLPMQNPNAHKITDLSVSLLTNLKTLNLNSNSVITNSSVTCLIKLTSFCLYNNHTITNAALLPLSNLTYLNLGGNRSITGHGISHLTSLTSLNLARNFNISDIHLKLHTNLISLDVSDGMRRNTGSFSHLPKLKTILF